MSAASVDQILAKISSTEDLYHRLILVVGPSGAGKTTALQTVAQLTGFRYVNINLELSRQLLDLTTRQRALQVARLLDEILAKEGLTTALLDNTEILFDVSLKQDPLRLLQSLSRNRTLVATWNGSLQNNYLTYGEPDHPEYKRYSAGGLITVALNGAT